jgi:hypothetical protein
MRTLKPPHEVDIYPALAASRIRRARLAKVRSMRIDRAIRVRAAYALKRRFGRLWAEAEAWADSLIR